jgi:large subunit ribosomal protein L15
MDLAIKNRKSRKYRGSRTCGGGNAQKRRGAGHRGGRGNAGVKGQMRSWYLSHDPDALVHKGPGRPDVPSTVLRGINIRTLEEKVEEFVASGAAKKKAKKIHLDLSDIGYDKLLGAGIARNAWVITAGKTSKVASRKIEEAGGEVRTEEMASETEEAS